MLVRLVCYDWLMLQFTISGDTPSQKNSKQILVNRRTGARFISSSAHVKAWQSAALWELRSVALPNWTYPLSATLLFYFSNKRRHDLDNCTSSVLDILVKAEIIKGDDYTCLCCITSVFKAVDKSNPRVEIWLDEAET